MYFLHPNIPKLIYNVDQYTGFDQSRHNISDVQSTYQRI